MNRHYCKTCKEFAIAGEAVLGWGFVEASLNQGAERSAATVREDNVRTTEARAKDWARYERDPQGERAHNDRAVGRVCVSLPAAN